MSPCADKMDPERLACDLPKYKPYISPTSWVHREKYLANLENVNKQKTQPWSLPELHSASIRASQQRNENVASSRIISPEALALLDKETAAPPPVNLITLLLYSIDLITAIINTDHCQAKARADNCCTKLQSRKPSRHCTRNDGGAL